MKVPPLEDLIEMGLWSTPEVAELPTTGYAALMPVVGMGALGLAVAAGLISVLYLLMRPSSGTKGKPKSKGKRKIANVARPLGGMGIVSFEPFKCIYRRQLTEDVFQFRFEGSLDSEVGGHVQIQGYYNDEETGERKQISRSYTPTSHHSQEGYFELVIKRYPTGKLTPWICDANNVDIGMDVMMRKKKSRLGYTNNKWKHIILLGAGTGITPLYQIGLHMQACEEESTKVTLIYQSRTEKNILLEDSLNKMAAAKVWDIHHVLSRPSDAWQGLKGRLSMDQVKQVMDQHGLTAEMSQDGVVQCMLCGPGGFNKSVKGHLKEMGFKRPFVF